MCLLESTELQPTCCEFHKMPDGCRQGRDCPAQRPVKLTQNQIDGADDMLAFSVQNRIGERHE